MLGELVRSEINDDEARALVRVGFQRALAGDIAWFNALANVGGEAFYAAKESEGTTVNMLVITDEIMKLGLPSHLLAAIREHVTIQQGAPDED